MTARPCVCCGAPAEEGELCEWHAEMRRRVARIVADTRRKRKATG